MHTAHVLDFLADAVEDFAQRARERIEIGMLEAVRAMADDSDAKCERRTRW
ncbi:MAG TPA: hypothetical protein VFC14_04295 [Burkholderiales bacterium]|nr:hypothetical protein [Burkholderiales bacterium]